MYTATFVADQFVNASSFNTAVSFVTGGFSTLASGTFFSGLINPGSITFAATGLNVGINIPLSSSILFGTGVLASAHGTIAGQDTQSYVVPFSGVVPASGSQTVYCLAAYMQVQQDPLVIIGPPPGHPDYNPNFQPFTSYATLVDSLSLTASVSAADNISTFELFRTTLTSGSTGISSFNTDFWTIRSPHQVIQPILNNLSNLSAEKFNYLGVSGTYTLPAAATHAGVLISIATSASGVTIAASGSDQIYGSSIGVSGLPSTPISSFTLGNGIATQLIAASGQWQILTTNIGDCASDYYYDTHGIYSLTVPDWAAHADIDVWGAGGGGSGSLPGGSTDQIGASGAGGGYAGTRRSPVTPNATMTIIVGEQGAPASEGGQAGTGGTSSISGAGLANTISATGGTGGSSGPGAGGIGTGGTINLQGSPGTDLDGTSWPANGSAPSGGAAFMGVIATMNQSGDTQDAAAPGCGGPANYNQNNGGYGVDGAVRVTFYS